MTLDLQQPARRLVLNESAAAILFCCDGINSVREIARSIGQGQPRHLSGRVAAGVRECLVDLARNLLIELSTHESQAAPIVRVRFLDFWPGFRPTCNYFTRMMASHMLALVVDQGEADISFRYAPVSPVGPQPGERTEGEHLRVLVCGDPNLDDFRRFDYVFSPRDVAGGLAASHCRLAPEDYFNGTEHSVPPSVSQRFHDFLFPLDAEDLPPPLPEPATGRERPALPAAAGDARGTGGGFHVLFSVDRRQSDGLFALINSIVTNSERPEQFVFHVLVDDEPDLYLDVLATEIPQRLRYEVVSFPETPLYRDYRAFVDSHIRVEGNAAGCTRLSNIMNFARLYLADLFPAIDVGLYLDVDMIVQSDLAEVFRTDVSSSILAAVLDQPFHYYHTGLDLQGRGFNAGTLLINFRQWRQRCVRQAVESLMAGHRRRRLFRGGTEPLLNVVLNGYCAGLDASWNVTGLGFREGMDPRVLAKARILHWNGGRKPWHADGLYREFWEPYRVEPSQLRRRRQNQPENGAVVPVTFETCEPGPQPRGRPIRP